MYKINIILFCGISWSLCSMEKNIKTPPGSPQRKTSYKNAPIQLNFKNDTNGDLDILIYVEAIQKMRMFSLSKGTIYCTTSKGDQNQFLSLRKPNSKKDSHPVMLDMNSYFLDKDHTIKETICVNTDNIFLYYEFLQNPVKLNITISLQRIWAHAEKV